MPASERSIVRTTRHLFWPLLAAGMLATAGAAQPGGPGLPLHADGKTMLVTKSGLAIDDITPTQTSFPGFENLLATLAS